MRDKVGSEATAPKTHDTPYGRVDVRWQLDDGSADGGELRLDVVVPPGVTAEVLLPGDTQAATVGSGTHTFTCPAAQVPVDSDTGQWGAHAHV